MKKPTFILLILLVFVPKQSLAHVALPANTEVKVSAFVGEHTFYLYGYTSPKAKVSFEGVGIFDQTYSNEDGYFEFRNRFSPLSSREACLSTQDQVGRLSNPICLPPFPIGYDVTIGPVLLPPTISLNKEYYFVGQEAVVSGQTIPDSEVDIGFYVDDKHTLANFQPGIVRPAQAFTFPELKTRSDAQGNFSVRLPSSNADIYRIFGQADYKNDPSGKSNTLYYKILPWWMAIFTFFQWLWLILSARLIELVVFGQIIFLAVYFVRRYLHPHAIANNRALVLREKHDIVKK